MNTVITVRSEKARVVHWFRDREAVGPHTAPALCGKRPSADGWLKVAALSTCRRCINRLTAEERQALYPLSSTPEPPP
jgi:hypothetical protein